MSQSFPRRSGGPKVGDGLFAVHRAGRCPGTAGGGNLVKDTRHIDVGGDDDYPAKGGPFPTRSVKAAHHQFTVCKGCGAGVAR